MTDWANQFLISKPRRFIILASWVLLALVGVADDLSGHFVEVEFFYLVPISIVCWYGNRTYGIATAVIATLVSAVADRPSVLNPAGLAVSFWGTIVKLTFFLFVAQVLSKFKAQTLELQELASQDPLTRVANRRSCLRALQVELNRCVRFGSIFTVAYIDLDNFKELNDRLGHDVGDTFLRKFAGTMRRNTRKVDTVARLGGDEFVIVLPDTDLPRAKSALTKVERLLSQLVKQQHWKVTFSIGVVTFSQCPESVEKILSIADRAMYAVKRKGKNNVAFTFWKPRRKKVR